MSFFCVNDEIVVSSSKSHRQELVAISITCLLTHLDALAISFGNTPTIISVPGISEMPGQLMR